MVGAFAVATGLANENVAQAAGDKPAAATPTEKATCLSASESGQSLRKAGKLRDARAQLLICAADRCPAVVRGDCGQWASEVAVAIPSMIFVAHDTAGQPIADVSVTVDGAPLPGKLDGTPVSFDPGDHVVRFTRAGTPAVEQTVTLAEGDKRHEVAATFDTGASATQAAAPIRHEAAKSSSGSLVGPIAFGIAGVVGVGVGAILVLKASGDVSNLRTTCAPNCSSSDVDSARNKAFLGDALIGGGVASLVAAGYMLLTRGSGNSGDVSEHGGRSASTTANTSSILPSTTSSTGVRLIDVGFVPSVSGGSGGGAVLRGQF